jgi:hypothetical protein
VDKLTHDLAEALLDLMITHPYPECGALGRRAYEKAEWTRTEYKRQLEQSERDKQNLYP